MTDALHRFLFESHPVRGEFATLDGVWQTVLERRDYPAPVRRVLGEAMAAAALLSATIKYTGVLTLQLQAPGGRLRLLVVQVHSDRTLRGLARWDETAELPDELPLAGLCGHGTLVISIETEGAREPYQGIVPLDGESIAAALEHWFAQSEQLPTRLVLAADAQRAAGLLLQRLPGVDADADHWQRVTQLGATLTAAELLSEAPETLLHRLFHEEDVRSFGAEALAFRCSCSRSRSAAALRTLGAEELRALLAERGGTVGVDCEFCGQAYTFDAVDVEALLAAADAPSTAQ